MTDITTIDNIIGLIPDVINEQQQQQKHEEPEPETKYPPRELLFEHDSSLMEDIDLSTSCGSDKNNINSSCSSSSINNSMDSVRIRDVDIPSLTISTSYDDMSSLEGLGSHSRSVPNLSMLLSSHHHHDQDDHHSICDSITPIASMSAAPSPSLQSVGSCDSFEDRVPITLGNMKDNMKDMSEHTELSGPLVAGIRPTRVGKLFDHFIVVGLPPTMDIKCTQHDERQRHAPQILYSYPPETTLPNDMIAQFCFPSGVESRSSQRSASYSSLNQIAFCNLATLLNPDHSFVFLLNTSDSLYYGVCIVKDEELCSLPSFVPTSDAQSPSQDTTTSSSDGGSNESSPSIRNRDQFDFIAPRVYCLLTRFPFFQLHFQILHSMLERERMLMLFSLTESSDPNSDVRTMDILNMYYGINMETVREKIQFKIPGQDYKTDFHCPLGGEDRLIADWSLFTMFESMNMEDIVTMFAWALMERSILVVSKDLGNVSSLIFSFIPLLRPFVWQCCFIPILPEALIESLEAPFPFIIGINELPKEVLASKKDYLIVDVDNKKIIYPSNSSQVPTLPGSKKLLETLLMQKKETFKLQNIIPLDHLKSKYTENIITTFKEYHSWIVDQISSGVITCINNSANTTTIDAPSSIELLNKQSIHFLEDHHKQVLHCLPDDFKRFFDQFFHSQMFASNAVRLMLAVQEQHKNNISEIEKLDAKIQLEEKSREILLEQHKIAIKGENNRADINTIKQLLRESEDLISELKEGKRKLEMEALAISPNKNNNSLTALLGLSEIRKKKLEFGHRRSRSTCDQVEKNILNKRANKPASVFPFFDLGRSSLSRSQSPRSHSPNVTGEKDDTTTTSGEHNNNNNECGDKSPSLLSTSIDFSEKWRQFDFLPDIFKSASSKAAAAAKSPS
ncbi:hypothetical protein SAMD00019534_051320 [Acytostelium subglobosum LB1]|uniref:hypothetical protein n=1 Tax=Acytostelium subglobosum LB1 TaxID=1410327 RepID=UPI0006449787|nr:hypothetical protein SAMD00019534_051320 [Acytostelium subglobosum LB1]GAM21957.1 hypothetical protein SAMD00019534_051320 [Acytostelium subglobosum LB1]|eukprot:XP_012755057.1 hypothetical protein SAMD00019534_051320 [Acytostelium subglobosum LB1]